MKNKTMNHGKGELLKSKYPELKEAEVFNAGGEECLKIQWTEAEAEKFAKKYGRLNGAFSKVGFIACNLHNL